MSNKLFFQIAALILLAGVVVWAVLKSQQPPPPELPDTTTNVAAPASFENLPPLTEEQRRSTAETMNRVMNEMRQERR